MTKEQEIEFDAAFDQTIRKMDRRRRDTTKSHAEILAGLLANNRALKG